MKVVLDTNVFVSGIFYQGPPYRILQAWRDGKIEIVVSEAILEEYRLVARRLAACHPPIDITGLLDLVGLKATLYDPPTLPARVCADPNDEMFIACALAGGATIIISGDSHLLEISGYHGILVLKPRTFVDRYLPKG